ncbi:MAG: metalloregulator ArsR/SmtB family transcription factor [Pseudomonadota bacterium]
MPLEQAAAGFAAMGSDARLAVLRLLVRAGHAGRTVGQLQSALDLPASTLAHHLRTLAVAGLVTQEKRGRSVINRGAFDHLERLGQFVLAECCHDQQAAPRIVDTRDEEHKDVER